MKDIEAGLIKYAGDLSKHELLVLIVVQPDGSEGVASIGQMPAIVGADRPGATATIMGIAEGIKNLAPEMRFVMRRFKADEDIPLVL